MSQNVRIGDMANVIMEGLEEYAGLASDVMKDAVKKSAKTVRKEIQANAPKQSGDYQKSWKTKTLSESSVKLDIVVHSSNRYQLAHLLEFGHATRDGGRIEAQPHIAPAEQKGIEELERRIREGLSG